MSKRKAFTERDEAFTVQETKKNHHLSAPKLTDVVRNQLNIDVKSEAVKKVLRTHGFNYWFNKTSSNLFDYQMIIREFRNII